MLAEFWIKLEGKKNRYRTWDCGNIETRKSKPTTKANEIAIKLSVEIPDSYFETPDFSAKITVPADSVNKPVITPIVQDNIGKLLSEQLGFKVHISSDVSGEE